jgi:electron transport complex protein RnfG
MAKESSFKNMVITLSVICLVCSALLGVVYSVTKAPIEAAELAKINNAIKAVVPECDNNPSEEMIEVEGSVVYPAKVNGNIVGYAIKVKVSGFGGPIQMMVGFKADGTIYNTSVISHSETPGLGAKITGEIPTRTQIVGKNPASSNLTVTKDGGEIDAITASTITSRAFLKGVEAAYKVFVELQKQQQPWEN